MKPLILLTGDQKVAEIKRLYYRTTRPTIQQDLAKAIDLVKSMGSDEERERVAVYMDGLAQMRSDWTRGGGARRKMKSEKWKAKMKRG
jgi:hypothetical protein